MFARWTAITCGVLLIVVSANLSAQTNVTGYISGVVTSSETDPIAGASVTATRLATDTRRTILSGADGGFRFAALPIGEYQILVEAERFESVERGPITVTIGGATRLNVTLASDDVIELETVTVVGRRISTIDVEIVESTTIITDETINRLPVARDLTSVALLAPGTTRSPVFELVGFGGASVAENAYYLNGMNMTNFYNGLKFTQPPFEFYQEFEVMTGGYGAEFGRSMGGVVNAVSKSGGDTFEFGTAVFQEPDELRETSPNVFNLNENRWLDYFQYTSPRDYSDSLKVQANASGPLVKDYLFFYALVESSQTDWFHDPGPSSMLGVDVLQTFDASADDTFWGLKLDWQINPGHLVEFTAFSDASTSVVARDEVVDWDTGELGLLGRTFENSGGENYILRYTGYFGQALTLSVLAGQNEYDRTESNDAEDIPFVQDYRPGHEFFPTEWLNFWAGTLSDQRRMLRFDGEWDGGDHLLRFGLDYEKNTTEQFAGITGGFWWTYFDVVPGMYFWPGGFVVPDGVTQIAGERISEFGGSFEVINTALYFEDHWRINDAWMLYAGIRNETFDNRNAVGETFVEMDDQWAPRLGFSWDVKSDLGGKLFGTAGRYFLPMPSRVNELLSGAIRDTQEWFVLEGVTADSTPVKGDLLASYMYRDGTVPDVTQLLDTDLDPTYQDEYILGYVQEVSPGWSLGVRGIYRDMKNAIEDSSFGQLVNEYAWSNGFEGFYTHPLFTYVLTNPGTDASLRFDLDYDGDYEDIYFTAAETGMPKVRRTYKALELFFEREWRNGWALQGSYTWSEAKGNYEGWTDSYHSAAGGPTMQSFDTPKLMEGAYGKLASDRPQTLKLFGAWDFAEHWQMSGNFLFQSGMAYGARGCHPEPDLPWCDYFYDDGEIVPRGSRGRSDDIYQLDLGLQFSLPLGDRDGRLYLRVDMINVFDSDTATQLNESTVRGDGERNLMYLSPRSYQPPRYARLSARISF